MKTVVLEAVIVKADNIAVTSEGEIIVKDPDQKHAILNQCLDVDFVFRRIVAELKLPVANGDGTKKEFQQGSSEAKINHETGMASVVFFVEAEEEDLISTVKQRYDERKSFEFEQVLQPVNTIAHEYDSEALSAQELGELREEFEDVTKNSCLLKKFKDVSKIAEIGLKLKGDHEPIFNGFEKARIKQVFEDLDFNFLQNQYEASVEGFEGDSVKVTIFDDQKAEQTIFISAIYMNENYIGAYISHYLSSRPFFLELSDPESLKLSKNPNKKFTPSSVSGLLDEEECMQVYKDEIFYKRGQTSLPFWPNDE